MRILAVLGILLLQLGVLGCNGNGGNGPACIDDDGDGFGENCSMGPDCDDLDENNWASCTTCLDADSDLSFAGCDAYASIAGPDCDDADVDNQTTCAACVDADGDGSFVGCGAYTVRTGPDCSDADADNQTSCATCIDLDSDSHFVGCDAYGIRSGPDCDDTHDRTFIGAAPQDSALACMRDVDMDGYGDPIVMAGVTAGTDCDDSNIEISPGAAENEVIAGCVADLDSDGYASMIAPAGGVVGTDCNDDDPNNFASCATCADLDFDLSYAACDSYVSIPGPDCDDADTARSSIEPELADDGIDNDCSGSDLVAAMGTGTYVDDSSASCTDAVGAGTIATPYCSLSAALTSSAAAAGADIFVATGTHLLQNVSRSSTGVIRIYGGYGSTWVRNLSASPTTVDSTGSTSVAGLFYSGPGLILDGINWQRTTAAAVSDLVLQTTSFSAVTRSTFDVADGTRPAVDFRGAGILANSHALLRDVRFDVSGSSRVVITLNFATFRLENNEFDLRGPRPNMFVVIARNNRDFVVNNTFYGNNSFSALTTSPGAQTTYLVGNSFFVDAASPPTLIQLRSSSFVLVNNGFFTTGNGRFFNSLNVSGSVLADATILNNIVDTGSAIFGERLSVTSVGNETYTTAASANACATCLVVGGNLDGDIGFVDAAMGDFTLGVSSPGIDGGADPTTHVPYFRVREDKDAVARPLDGDGLNGAEWDVGAVER